MASSRNINLFSFLFSLLLVQIALVKGGFHCEDLGKENCSFAVSSTGHRCILEKMLTMEGMESHICKTSSIRAASTLKGIVEIEQCITDCGLDRSMLGISSDSLLDINFYKKICSPFCYTSCPNIVDLFFNLAADEGVFLPSLCKSYKGDRRGMTEVDSKSEAPSSFAMNEAQSPSFMDENTIAETPY